MKALLARHPWMPYVVPFVAFAILVLAWQGLPGWPRTQASIRMIGLGGAVALFAWPVLTFRLTRPLATIAVGVLVFVLWIAPDQLIPGYRDSPLFQNSLTGKVASTISVEARTDWLVLSLRFIRASLVVPIIEELFWRGWLGRWLDRMDGFEQIPLGQYSAFSFGATVLLFGIEHGPFWDVGLVAGVIYNWWMIKTRSLGDLIWCHAVTNGCLSIWVVALGEWQYW